MAEIKACNSYIDYNEGIKINDEPKAISYLKKVKKKKTYLKAKIKLAEQYQYGYNKNLDGVIKRYAMPYNNIIDEYALSVATLYHYGDVFQDYKKALQWYKKVEGVDKGAALNSIGLLYLNGHGIKQDRQKYLYYFLSLLNSAVMLAAKIWKK
jgi:TPR repeat protein